MKTKNKIIKTARICHKITKGLYYASCVLCLTFIVLAIALSCTKAIKTFTVEETACLFGTLALYSFMSIGLLWNVASIFKNIEQEKAPFSEKVSYYLKRSSIFVVLISVIPALIGSTVLRIICPTTDLTFPISLGGIISGITIFMIDMFFNYGKELQKNEDETLW